MGECDEKHGIDYSTKVDYIKIRRIVKEEVREAIEDLIKAWGATLERLQDMQNKKP